MFHFYSLILSPFPVNPCSEGMTLNVRENTWTSERRLDLNRFIAMNRMFNCDIQHFRQLKKDVFRQIVYETGTKQSMLELLNFFSLTIDFNKFFCFALNFFFYKAFILFCYNRIKLFTLKISQKIVQLIFYYRPIHRTANL